MEKISGIYSITNKINNKIYIGSSVDVSNRWYNHTRLLKKNSHHNIHLQHAWNKYGQENFVFELLELSEIIYLHAREQSWIDTTRCFDSDCGYNIALDAIAPGRGRSPSEATKEKLRIAMLGRVFAEETKERMRAAQLGKKHSDEAKLNMSKAFRGRTHTPEARLRISKNHRCITGEKNPGAKLTCEQVLEIRKLSSEGFSYLDISKIYGLNRKYIGEIVRKQVWKNI